MNTPTVLILGATSDIGWAIAEEYRRIGSPLILTARNTSHLSQRMGTPWPNTTVLPFDALDFASHRAWFQSLPVVPDVVVCVFGYMGEQSQAETDWQEAKAIIDTNYTGCVSVLNIVSEAFKTRKSGSIVGISSVAGDRGRQSNFIYGSAKAAFSAYLSGLRNKLFSTGVHVLTVKPGFVRTKMTSGLKLPKPLTAEPAVVAKKIVKSVNSRKNVLYVLPVWRLVMLVIRNIPEFIFKRMKL